MIDFACKKFDINEIVKCSLNLSKSDFNILKFLLKNNSKKFPTEEIANKLSLDQSTIQRSVKKLYEKGLITRSQMNKEGGGYLFYYKIKNKSEINSLIIGIIDNWSNTVKENIKSW
jgi:predicted transcriptional regulator